MQTDAPFQATLWRTCRVLANRVRLEMFGCVLRQPDQTVSAVAHHLRQPVALCSLYLRALEARGLLIARRQGRWVSYRPAPANGPGAPSGLVAALRATFQSEAKPVEAVFRLATAFTHPRRIEIFRLLQAGPRPREQLGATGRISGRAVLRHLRKLEARNFVTQRAGLYATTDRRDALGRELVRMAAG